MIWHIVQLHVQKPKIEGNKDDIFGDQAKNARKKTEEGYAVYSEVSLQSRTILPSCGIVRLLCPVIDC